MGIMTDSGRAAIAAAVKAQPIFMAWGTGGESWGETPPTEDERSIRLVNEVGRKALFRSLYVYPDDEGEIEISEDSRYAISIEPTKYLYLEFDFNFRDGLGEKIREIGIFMGGSTVAGLSPDQSYFLPTEVLGAGTLIMLQHRETVLERVKSERCPIAHIISF